MAALIANLIDMVLAVALVLLAWLALSSADLFRAIILFISFGLVLALLWVRLDAPDIALAEAAIGAGLAGALLLAAYAKLCTLVVDPGLPALPPRGVRMGFYRGAVATGVGAVAAGLGYIVWTLPTDAAGLSAEVAANLADSGVTNPVTAVLLNFRGYDTLLEVLVLLLALLGVWSLNVETLEPHAATDPVLVALPRFFIPVLILVAAYLLWRGAHAPGGAFQAGAVLSAAGVLLLLAGWRPRPRWTAMPLRILVTAGPLAFVGLALLTLMVEGRMLQLPRELAGAMLLGLETIATLSIAAPLAGLFFGGRPAAAGEKS